jgi:hypothetical protein
MQAEQRAMRLEEGYGRVAVWLIGSVLATVISWSRNASILWAILHCILGWLYVLYYALVSGRIWKP